MNLTDLPEIVGLCIGSFGIGYSLSWIFYVFRRVIWQAT